MRKAVRSSRVMAGRGRQRQISELWYERGACKWDAKRAIKGHTHHGQRGRSAGRQHVSLPRAGSLTKVVFRGRTASVAAPSAANDNAARQE